jgi:hypothetical protein
MIFPHFRTHIKQACVIFQIFTAVRMKTTAFWDIASCSLVEVTDVLEARTASIIRMIEEVRISETSVCLETYTVFIPEDSRLQQETEVVCNRK